VPEPKEPAIEPGDPVPVKGGFGESPGFGGRGLGTRKRQMPAAGGTRRMAD
jgi:hypothetical protein